MTHDEIIEIITAHRDKVPLQIQGSDAQWLDANIAINCILDSIGNGIDWRLKPKPREIWVNEYRTGLSANQFNSPDVAAKWADVCGNTVISCRKFVEVVE